MKKIIVISFVLFILLVIYELFLAGYWNKKMMNLYNSGETHTDTYLSALGHPDSIYDAIYVDDDSPNSLPQKKYVMSCFAYRFWRCPEIVIITGSIEFYMFEYRELCFFKDSLSIRRTFRFPIGTFSL